MSFALFGQERVFSEFEISNLAKMSWTGHELTRSVGKGCVIGMQNVPISDQK